MQEQQKLDEETIDIKNLILRYAQYWYYFILAIFFFFFIAFLNNRYTVPEYSVSTTLLIRDDNNTQMGAENLLEGLEIFSGKKNLKNEMIILNSYSMAEKIVTELELGVSYFQHGFIISNELFDDYQNSSSICNTILIDNTLSNGWSEYNNYISQAWANIILFLVNINKLTEDRALG